MNKNKIEIQERTHLPWLALRGDVMDSQLTVYSFNDVFSVDGVTLEYCKHWDWEIFGW